MLIPRNKATTTAADNLPKREAHLTVPLIHGAQTPPILQGQSQQPTTQDLAQSREQPKSSSPTIHLPCTNGSSRPRYGASPGVLAGNEKVREAMGAKGVVANSQLPKNIQGDNHDPIRLSKKSGSWHVPPVPITNLTQLPAPASPSVRPMISTSQGPLPDAELPPLVERRHVSLIEDPGRA
ncbi:hypothetical protein K458DRAFT_393100 [Lentithecium fluviatile CBS 122367]|uniref:Uncharacterized protein n=1 Tax=Lentithecium fluviatile CBS 122367 TaxID=1168545 RepID=A0A6G1IPF8_9PLEO|nr:hypothetical protein K458DRAFT_393100 [Lentithecium fluviatile CBS 122367]